MHVPPRRRGLPAAVTRVGAGLVAASLAAGLFMLATPVRLESRQAAWKQDWNVRCTWADWMTQMFLSAALLELLGPVPTPEALELAEDIADFNCDDKNLLGLAGQARLEFRGSSRWLEDIDFPDPVVALAPDARKYMSWIDQYFFRLRDVAGDPLRNQDGRLLLEENGRYLGRAPGEIFISPPQFRKGEAVEAHETFHGVQNKAAPSAFMNNGQYAWGDWWVWEGTAAAAETVWAWKARPAARRIARYWDFSLYWIESWFDNRAAYGTVRFWHDLGRQLRSEDYVTYLRRVFEAIEAQPAPGSGPSTATLRTVDRTIDEMLQERGVEGEGGFYRAYPEFVRYALSDPLLAFEHFKQPYARRLQLPSPMNGGPVDELVERFEIGALAANAHLISVAVPPSRVASLRIEVESPDDAQYRNLHLIVSDRRYDRKEDPADPNAKRNVFATTISGSDRIERFYVRVANVANPVTEMDDVYTLKLTLQSDEALAIVTGAENVRLQDGVLFSYVNATRDPGEMANSMQEALLERNSDHAGLSRESPEGAQARAAIAATFAGVVGPPRTPRRGEARSAVTPGSRCMAMITIFDDESRSVVKMTLDTTIPLFGNTHDIRAGFGTDLHDSVYSTAKTVGQELTMLENPEALALWGQEFQQLTLTGLDQLLQDLPGSAQSIAFQTLLGGMFRGLPFLRPREGQPPAATGGELRGRGYEGVGNGSLTVEKSFGDKTVGRYSFTAVNEQTGESVNVEGQFIAVSGPLTEDNLWHGCERMLVPAEDNGDITLAPGEYPPGFETDCTVENNAIYCFCTEAFEQGDYASVLLCFCAFLPFLCPPDIEWENEDDCRWEWRRSDGPWRQETLPDGTIVYKRTVRYDVVETRPARAGGRACPEGFDFPEERRIPPTDDDSSQDCIPDWSSPPSVMWVIDDAYEVRPAVYPMTDWEVADVGGRQVWRRTVLRYPGILVPASNGGSWRPCDPIEETEIIEIPPPPPPGADLDCVPGPATVTVIRDWHQVQIGGMLMMMRVVRYTPSILRPPLGNGSWRPCDPWTEEEFAPILGDPDAAAGDPASEPGSEPTPGGTLEPAPDVTVELGPNLVLDFLEEGQANLQSAPQSVQGSGSLTQIDVTGRSFNLTMPVSNGEVAACRFDATQMAVARVLTSRRLVGGVQLDVNGGTLTLSFDLDGAMIIILGRVTLSPLSPTSIRGDVSGGTLQIRADITDPYTCAVPVMDFAFTLTEER